MLSLGPNLDLVRLKTAFASLVKHADPDILPAFMLWVDLKVSEFKVTGTVPPALKIAHHDLGHTVEMVLDDIQNKCNNLDSCDTAETCGTQTSPVNQAFSGRDENRPADFSRTQPTSCVQEEHPQTVPTDLSSKRRHQYDDLTNSTYSPRKSLKSIIDNIVKTETLSEPRFDLKASHMALPIMMPTVPLPPLPISSIAQHHASLARLLARGPMVLPPPVTAPYIPCHNKLPEHDMVDEHAFPHKKFRPDMPSEQAVCVKKELTSMSPDVKEASFPESNESMSPSKTGHPVENILSANTPAMPHSPVNLPPTSNVTSALRELLTAKLSSQLSNNMETESQGSERLMIDEDNTCENIDFDSDMSQGGLTEEDLLDRSRQPNTCQVCGQSFQYRSSFRRHMKVHQGIFSHVCAVCGRKFTRKEHFVRHKCSRKPNKASRGAHVDSPAAMGITPKVEFPPMSSPDQRSETSYDGSYQEFPESPAKQKYSFNVESRRKAAVPRKIVMVEEGDMEEEQMENMSSPIPTEERTRSQQSAFSFPSLMKNGSCPSPNQYHRDMYYSPRKEQTAGQENSCPQQELTNGPDAASQQEECSDDVGNSPYNDPEDCTSPDNNETHVTPYSPITDPDSYSPQREQETWGGDGYAVALDLSRPQVTSSCSPTQPDQTTGAAPMQQATLTMDLPTQQEFTIHTGSYKVVTGAGDEPVSGERGKFIKVIKQGNYLKLKEEAQIIGGQLCFVCPTCSKVFHRSSNFSRHMRIHRGVYSYVCPNCQRGFFRREHFQKHKCSRKGMSHTWDRKTKIDMVLAANESALECSDAEGGSEHADSEDAYPITAVPEDNQEITNADQLVGAFPE